MLEVDDSNFWGRKARITPSAVRDKLPLYRKQARDKANGHAALTEAQLAEYADRQEATA